MSDRDPKVMSHRLNPKVNNFAPDQIKSYQQQNSAGRHTNAPPSTYLEARVLNLEEEHSALCGEIATLRELCQELSFSVDKLKSGEFPVHVRPLQEPDLSNSCQSAVQFKEELEKLNLEVHTPVDGSADKPKANLTTSVNTNGTVPLHLEQPGAKSGEKASTSLPPHLRGKCNSIMDGANRILHQTADMIADTAVTKIQEHIVPAPVLSPSESPRTIVQHNISDMEDPSLGEAIWRPYFISKLPAMPTDVVQKIPLPQDMVTFHPDFLRNTLGGTPWSPGLRFIKSSGVCMLPNPTYYELDPSTEPFLPTAPGKHGAKLTAFFNKSPEEDFSDLFQEDVNTYENVPMFVLLGNRYIYYGNYSQSRWSDKLDYDTMKTRVPQHIKEYWAQELTATPREGWVTEELKKHFFPKPAYEGRLYTAPSDKTTVNSEVEIHQNEQMAKHVKKYVEELREWNRETNMKTAMMKKQDILNAFEAADADDPPALRLWWEYLECIDWKKDFYDLLVTLQSREKKNFK